jgi:hypothetical protein
MPDISMCANKECPSNDSCLRFVSKPNPYYQSYADFKPDASKKKCSYYIKNIVKKQVVKEPCIEEVFYDYYKSCIKKNKGV